MHSHASMHIQSVSGGKVNILGGHSIGHSKVSETKLFYVIACIKECSQTIFTPCPRNELQSALMLTVEFSKMYYAR
jgi:hypothetical protein